MEKTFGILRNVFLASLVILCIFFEVDDIWSNYLQKQLLKFNK